MGQIEVQQASENTHKEISMETDVGQLVWTSVKEAKKYSRSKAYLSA